MKRLSAALLLPLIAVAAPALAQDEPLCADRPGLGTPPCATEKGRVVGELGLVSWTLAKGDGERTDTIVAGDTLARFGLGGGTELQVGWTAFGSVRDRAGGAVSRRSGVGDVSVGVLQEVVKSDALALSVLGRATLPTGGQAIGAGDWSAALYVPVEIELTDLLSFELTPSVAAAVDEDRSGRHLDYGLVAGVSADFDTHFATVELAVDRDRDPAEITTPLLLGLSGGWRPSPDLQIDAGCNLGVDRDADDVQLYVGLARRF